MLTKNEKEVLKSILDRVISESNLLVGKFDAKNGDIHFMYGVQTVMDYFACLVSDDYLIEYEKLFSENFEKSIDKSSHI